MISDENCRPTVVTVDKSASTRIGVPMIRHAGARDALPLARATWNHDGVVFGGGGLIQDETGPLNIPFHLSRLATARMLRKPWVGVGLGIGQVDRPSGRLLARFVLRNAVAVSVRDRGSARRYRELTGQPTTTAADPVFMRTPRAVKAGPNLVVSLRRANSSGQRRLRSSAPPDEDRLRQWAEMIDAVAEPRGLEVRFIAWERGQDAPLHEAVAARLRSPAITEVPATDDIIERMGTGRLVLTMRYHGAIAALLHGRPCVMLDYSPKMADLASETHGGVSLVPLDAEPHHIVAGFNAVIERVDARSNALEDLRRRASANSEVIRQLALAARHAPDRY